MLTVDEALEQVLRQAAVLPSMQARVEQALGLVLAEEVQSDIDSPPHDKSMVDGYAIVAADLASGSVELDILEEVVAGAVPTRTVSPGCATRIMTGAPLPQGADAVVMIERSQTLPSVQGGAHGRVRIVDSIAKAGQNILPRGIAMRRGDVVVPAGARLRPIEIGLLAEVGREQVQVIRPPSVAVLSTGNELVPAHQTPQAGQIRNSNGPMLAACVAAAGSVSVHLGIARDDPAALRQLIARGLEADVLVLSGGVSAGVLDLVPAMLAEAGVKQVFHKVRLKPGKPLWFGMLEKPSAAPVLVFGLPGNPVSSLVCFLLFVEPALRRLRGHADPRPRFETAKLAGPFLHRGDRPTYHPGVLTEEQETRLAAPLPWHGSADLTALARANCLVHFPAGDREYPLGSSVKILPLQDRP